MHGDSSLDVTAAMSTTDDFSQFPSFQSYHDRKTLISKLQKEGFQTEWILRELIDSKDAFDAFILGLDKYTTAEKAAIHRVVLPPGVCARALPGPPLWSS